MARRGRRVAIWLLVVFVLLVGVLVVLDRSSAYLAERTIAEKVSQQTSELGISASPPEVAVGGFPFLTQVADGRYEEITILLRDVSANGVTVPRLDIRATGVNAEMNTLLSGDGQITADRIIGTATVGYASVRALFNRPGLELSERDGRLRLRLPLTVAGQEFTAVGVADVSVDSGRVRVAVVELTAEGVTLPAVAQRQLDQQRSRLSVDVRLPSLPFGLQIEQVVARPEGLAVTASATGVPLAS